MSLPFRIIYAAHANGTHHKLALDALRELDGPNAEAWQRVFLKHAELLLEGSKAPDKEFKDFQNHVLHPGDDYWGGAPEKVRNWYDHTVRALREQNWSEAAYCAGVMSHYYTDIVHPFHTAQSKAENTIHRAVEWSINKSYNALRREAVRAKNVERPVPTDGEDWVETLTCKSADRSHQDYGALIAHYNFAVGAAQPEDGFDPLGRRRVGILMLYAASGFALLLNRAIAEAGVTPPAVTLTAKTILSALKIPLKWVLRKIDDAEDRRIVQAMYDELLSTGEVDKTLPEDDRTVRDLHAREVLLRRAGERRQARDARVERSRRSRRTKQSSVGTSSTAARSRRSLNDALDRAFTPSTSRPDAQTTKSAAEDDRRLTGVPLTTGPLATKSLATGPQTPAAMTTVPQITATAQRLDTKSREAAPADPEPTSAIAVTATSASTSASASTGNDHPAEGTDLSGRDAIVEIQETNRDAPRLAVPDSQRFYLELESPIVDAPSIGRKTAARLEPAGILTVAGLLSCDPEAVAKALKMRHIKPATIRDWQHQAGLVLTVPELRGTHAQLLVGAGFLSAEDIAEASVEDVCAGVLDYARSKDGQRLLRDGAAPDIEKIKTWCENAHNARALAA